VADTLVVSLRLEVAVGGGAGFVVRLPLGAEPVEAPDPSVVQDRQV
jgi:hypothetical protein